MMRIKSILIWFAVMTAVVFTACGHSETAQPFSEEKETAAETSVFEEPVETVIGNYDDETDQVMRYEEFVSAELSQKVIIDCYVQDKRDWEDGKTSLFAQDEHGGYYLYHVTCSEEDYALLSPGKKIRVNGYKGIFQGRIEIEDAVFEFLEGKMIAEAADLTNYIGDDDTLNDYQNRKVCFHDLIVLPMADGSAFYYDWDNSGDPAGGENLYFKAAKRGQQDESMIFSVEYDLCDETSEVYQAVQHLNTGDSIEVEGYLFWYAGPLPLATRLLIPA